MSVKILNAGEFQEKLLCCKTLPQASKEQAVFNVVFISGNKGLSWRTALLSSLRSPTNGWLSTRLILFCKKRKKKKRIFCCCHKTLLSSERYQYQNPWEVK